MYEKLCDLDNLYNAWKAVSKQSAWKAESQLYEENLLINLVTLKKKLEDHTYCEGKVRQFLYYERGKERCIESRSMEDKIVQRCLSDYVLMPIITKYLQYDNSASIKGRGTSHFRKRLIKHLKSYYRECGTNEGYILTVDFRKFFDNVDHDVIIKIYEKFIEDEDVLCLIKQLIKNCEKDVSYLSDEEFKNIQNCPFDAIDYYNNHSSENRGEKILRRSVGIGSHLSQISGIVLPILFDNYCKIVKGIKYWGRYMDDSYIIARTKEELVQLLREIKVVCKTLGIFINEKKTQITSLKRKFTLLKVQYTLRQDGYIICTPTKANLTRERRHLKKLAKKLDDGSVAFIYVYNTYKSWRGSVSWMNCNNSIQNLDKLFNELFIKPFIPTLFYYVS